VRYDQQISLTIWRFEFDPAEVTDALGVAPTSAARRHSENLSKKLPRTTFWSLRSTPENPKATIDEHWDQLGRLLAGKERTILDYANKGDVVYTIVLSPTNKRPLLLIGNAFLRFIALSGGRLEVD
jgi:Domain of unknown function (DUF4279)